MKHDTEALPERRSDGALNWTLRIVGLVVVAASAFFLYRGLSLNPVYDYFFSMTTILGIVTIVAGWLEPARRTFRDRSHRSLEPAPERA